MESAKETDQSVRPGACAVIVSRYNESVTSKLLEGATRAYLEMGGDQSKLTIIDAPGAFELAVLGSAAAQSGSYESVVCLGCVIKGETEHDRHISGAIAHTIADTAAQTCVPIAFGVLTTNTADQAHARADGDQGNKGAEAMVAALQSAARVRLLAPGHEPGVRCVSSVELPDKASRAEEVR